MPESFKCGCHSVILRLSKDLDTGTPNCQPVLLIFPLIGKFHSCFLMNISYQDYWSKSVVLYNFAKQTDLHIEPLATLCVLSHLCIFCMNEYLFTVYPLCCCLPRYGNHSHFYWSLLAFVWFESYFSLLMPQYPVSKSPTSMMQKSSKQASTKVFKAQSYHHMSAMMRVNKYNILVKTTLKCWISQTIIARY